MVVTNARIMGNAVTADKIEDSAVQRIVLKAGEKFEIIASNGFTILRIDNDTRKIAVRGNIDKIR